LTLVNHSEDEADDSPFEILLFISMTESREFDGDADPVCEARVKEMLPT
jgi:hypothetical protein